MHNRTLLTVREAAAKLGVSVFKVYRRIQRGDIPAVPSRDGSVHFLIAEDDLDRYIADGGEKILTPPRRLADSDWITTGEAARRTGMTMEAVRNLCYAGRLTYLKGVGRNGRLKVSSASIDSLLERIQ